jgi:hypothetical protein
MAIDFPNTPSDGQVYTVGDRSWIYSSAAAVWNANFETQLQLISPLEKMNIVAAAVPATNHIDVATAGVWYHTVNATANWTTNFRGSSGITLNSLMAVGDSLSISHLATNGTTAYRATAHQVDGASVTPKWMNGAAPSAGSVSAIDLYGYTIIKTAASTFTLLASMLKFA